jgi:16S rRNA (cytosine967-C5)-methyltransferase
VLLDAPCSATGTLRRRPEVAWRKSPADVASLAALQAELLEAAARLTAPGGVLVYAVCSLEAAEGPDQIARFLSVRDDFRLDPIGADELQGLAEARLPDGTAQTLPFMAGGVDGFFIVRLRRSV